MKTELVKVITGAMVLVLFLSSCGSTPASVPTQVLPGATIVVSPIGGEQNTKLTIYGSGFLPGEKVQVVLTAEGVAMVLSEGNTGGSVEVNKNGAFVLKPAGGIPVTPLLQPGVYTLEAKGNNGSRATAPLEVVAPKK